MGFYDSWMTKAGPNHVEVGGETYTPPQRAELTLATTAGIRREVVDIPAAAVDLRERPGFFLEDGSPDLPAACPMVTEGPVPKGCRFHPRLFVRLMTEGALPINGACPMRRVCRVDQPKKETQNGGQHGRSLKQ